MSVNNSVNLNLASFSPTGTWDFLGQFSVNSPSSSPIMIANLTTNPFSPTAGQLYLLAQNQMVIGSFTSSITVTPQVGDLTLTAGSAGNATLGSPNTTTVNGGTVNLSTGNLLLSGIGSSATSEVLFFDSGTGAVTYGAAPGGSGVSLITEKTFFSNGNYNPPGDLLYAIIEAVAGGGGGGGAEQGTGAAAGSGGSAGSFTRVVISAGTLGAGPHAYTIGSAGTGGTGTAAGGNGGSTTFGTIIDLGGGFGGLGGSNSSSSFGQLGLPGGFVNNGGALQLNGGGGQSSLYSGIPTNGFAISGSGGNSMFGSGGRNVSVGQIGSIDGNTASGSSYGAGGSGAALVDVGADATGGNGSQGFIRILEFRG